MPKLFQGSTNISLGVSLLDTLTFVEFFLTSGYSEIELEKSTFIIHREWDDCQALGTLGFLQFLNLGSRQEEFPHSPRVVVGPHVIGLIRCNLASNEKGLAASHGYMRAGQRHFAGAYALDLVTKEFETSGKLLENLVVEANFWIIG